MKIYEYPKCSTCRAAKKFINNNKIKATFIDTREQMPSLEEIKDILSTFKIPIKKLFNTSGNKYKELKLKDKLTNISEEEALKILLSDFMLLKRPLAFNCPQEILLLGFNIDLWSKTFVESKPEWLKH